MVDGTNTVVWEGEFEPFGRARVNIHSTAVNNIRFPGQYYDQETGFHYKCSGCFGVIFFESYREGGKVKKRTIANLSKWPPELVENFRALLRGGTVVERLEKSFEVVRSRPYGHVAAVLGTLRKTGL
ncbi:MAG: hypothetical protein JRJ18_13030, partial [Deltaproteobacteria bacterium]|nr:hypothetical protein [Deltaproteobacteria bacterium]